MVDTQEDLIRLREEVAREALAELSEQLWRIVNKPWLEESKQEAEVRKAG